MKIRKFNENNNSKLVKTNINIQQVVGYSDLMIFINENENYFGFNGDTFHVEMVEYFFSDGQLTSIYSVESCEGIINKSKSYSSSYWDSQREYMKSVLDFLKINNIDNIRFVFDA